MNSEIISLETAQKITTLEKENKKYKEVINKAIEYINDSLIISSILDGKKYYTINNYSFDYRELLDILNEGKNEWDMETYKRFWKYIWNI